MSGLVGELELVVSVKTTLTIYGVVLTEDLMGASVATGNRMLPQNCKRSILRTHA